MYEIDYIVNGVRVAGFEFSGSQAAVREIAEDGLKRHRADHARIFDQITERAEIWPRPS
ncbi:MAG: hypothetical protein WAU68_06655 [Vitreimonas sp.]